MTQSGMLLRLGGGAGVAAEVAAAFFAARVTAAFLAACSRLISLHPSRSPCLAVSISENCRATAGILERACSSVRWPSCVVFASSNRSCRVAAGAAMRGGRGGGRGWRATCSVPRPIGRGGRARRRSGCERARGAGQRRLCARADATAASRITAATVRRMAGGSQCKKGSGGDGADNGGGFVHLRRPRHPDGCRHGRLWLAHDGDEHPLVRGTPGKLGLRPCRSPAVSI